MECAEAGPGEWRLGCEEGVIVWRVCCPTHTGNEVSSCVGGFADMALTIVCAMWPVYAVCSCGVDSQIPADFWRPVGAS